ncbi:hypothetical protein A2V49_04850 [candidate division WWE3 bacterium RBG_19FT_COMBO_34_6]|uniref:Glycosyl transferase family 1 domain-containing protein n=1 Tax=candidate division WWE3 bacterium RBG_19FT_COMBO_34_6 TaxID=1802612 RepID=A0A1F4UKU9_UNCKA|nr:MAG: hypothetical protein A2V49_04850 [candidate division WWE3 bacterium RBG_19FT_COMBO_34_6]
MKNLKVALIHDYLTQYGGAEKTLEAIIEIFPDADIFTSFYESKNMSDQINSKNIISSKKMGKFISIHPILSKYLTFLIPLIFENYDLGDYDLIISDSSSYAKGVITNPNQMHICYIHTPPRFLYKYSVENTKRNKWYYRWIVRYIDNLLRLWDFQAAQRPDFLVSNSFEIQKRIEKFYKRTSTVIHPPVDYIETKDFYPEKNYYLIAGRLVAYKNFDIVIKTFNELESLKLLVIGNGPLENDLKKMAGKNIKFLGKVNEKEKHLIMENCLGLINPVKDEDFGIVPVEVLLHGKPVLAHRSAGHLETIVEGVNGEFFDILEINNLKGKIIEFDKFINNNKYDANRIKSTAQKFTKEEFKRNFSKFVFDKLDKKNN